MSRLAEDPAGRLHSVASQINFLADCFSQPNGFIELSADGEGGLCEVLNSISDQAVQIAEELSGGI